MRPVSAEVGEAATLTKHKAMPAVWRPLLPILIAAAGFGLAVLDCALKRTSPPGLGNFLLVLGLVFASKSLAVPVRFGSNRIDLSWGEAALVVGLGLLPGAWLLPAVWVGVAGGRGLAGRGWLKTLFNAGSTTIGAAVAVQVVSFAHDRSLRPSNSADAGLLVAAAVAYVLVNHLMVVAAVSQAQRLSFMSVLRRGIAVEYLQSLFTIACGVGLLALVDWHRVAVLLLIPSVVVLYRVHVAGSQAMSERESWQRLEAATRELNRLDRRAVIDRAVVAASELFASDFAELILRSGRGERSVHGTALGVAAPDVPVTAWVGDHTVVTQPLQVDGRDLGELRLHWHDRVQLSDRERRAWSTFGHAVSAALLNAELYEQLRAEAERSAQKAIRDPLTGLANRSVLLSDGAQAVAAAVCDGGGASLLLFDLNRFKEINDTLGHEAGDVVLIDVANRLRGCVRHDDIVVRLGGDEFAIVLAGVKDPARAFDIALKIQDALTEPVRLGEVDIGVEASVGIAHAPQDATTVEELLRCADVAMYQAKKSTDHIQRFRPEHDPANFDRLALAGQLREAIEQAQFVLHYQPQFDLRNGRVIGAEALTRWVHPVRGLIPPDEFVPLIEQSALVGEFTLYVVAHALRSCANWSSAADGPTVAVNLSARNLVDRRLGGQISELLEAAGVQPNRLILEITETAAMSELDVLEEVLGDLRRRGVQLSVDDFGTGYSSLTFLTRVPLDEVKIDREFVHAMRTSTEQAAIVRAIYSIAHDLGLRIVAEGVETEDERDDLAWLGCDAAQGYYLGAPMPAEDIHALMTEQHTAAGWAASPFATPRQRSPEPAPAWHSPVPDDGDVTTDA